MKSNKNVEYKLSELSLDKIRGSYDNMKGFYDYMKERGYKIDKLKKDIKERGLINPVIVWDTENIYSSYRYFIKDGNHRLKLLKDMAIEDHKELKTVVIPAVIITRPNDGGFIPSAGENIILKIKEKYYTSSI